MRLWHEAEQTQISQSIFFSPKIRNQLKSTKVRENFNVQVRSTWSLGQGLSWKVKFGWIDCRLSQTFKGWSNENITQKTFCDRKEHFLTFIGSKKKTNLYHVLLYQKVSIRKSNNSIKLLTISLCLLLSFHTVWPEEMAGSKFLFFVQNHLDGISSNS